MRTQENNKMIAEFMGMKYSDKRSFNDGEWTHSIKSLSKFETSWDWLIPVVNKIRSFDCEFDIEQIGVFDWDDEISHYEFDLDLTYNAVVEFIKQHNESTD